MTDEDLQAEQAAEAPAEHPGAGAWESISPAEADRRASERTDSFAQRPELFAAAAFAGGFVAARVLKRLSGGE